MVYRFIYSVVFYLAIPLVLVRLLYRSLKEPLYRVAIAERFGCYKILDDSFLLGEEPSDKEPEGKRDQKSEPRNLTSGPIWIHAVSAGETIAAVPLIRRLVAKGYVCLVTHMTPTGRQRVEVLLADEIRVGTVKYCYAPYDLRGFVQRFIKNNRPRALLTIDTELWPNTIAACRANHIHTVLINGRLSARSAKGYARIAPLIGPMLTTIDLLTVQTHQHRERFLALGVAPERLHVTGSIKFDGEYATDHSERKFRLNSLIGSRAVLLGASTHEGEESALLQAYIAAKLNIHDGLLVLVPRHTHRTQRVLDLCDEAGVEVQRFSDLGQQASLDDDIDVLLVDVMGELEGFYEFAQIAFVGGSLVPVGGHNLLEAVRAGAPLVMGPHLDNIEDIAALFLAAEGMFIATNAEDLTRYVTAMLADELKRSTQISAANQVLAENRGSLDRAEALVLSLIGLPLMTPS
ncbi:MAG: 3-deoxy-D-manno-octulosonic-acid transferase [Candidatus Azotimanducaceae bacterium]|jgi:3-deoxy-D-manno-octulosonic-acid transferase